MGDPLVSVVMPAYNAGPYVGTAARSILAQSYRNLELIVVDDGSTDGTLPVLETLAAQDSRLKIISRENRGLIASLNEALAAANGDLVARMDADDISHPQRIQRQVDAFQARPGLALCATGFDRMWDDGIIEDFVPEWCDDDGFRFVSLFVTPFLHPTVMISRSVVGEELRYDSRYQHAEDFDLFRRICRNHRVHMIGQCLLHYRMHGASITRTHEMAMIETHFTIVSENLRWLGSPIDLSPLQRLNARRADEADIRACARALLEIEELANGMNDRDAAAFKDASTRFFFLVLHVATNRGIPMDQVADFAAGCNRAQTLRRRERYALQAARVSAGMARLWWDAVRALDRRSGLRRKRASSWAA